MTGRGVPHHQQIFQTSSCVYLHYLNNGMDGFATNLCKHVKIMNFVYSATVANIEKGLTIRVNEHVHLKTFESKSAMVVLF